MDIQLLAKNAKSAAIKLAAASTENKNEALLNIKNELWNKRDQIFEANQKDLAQSEKDQLAAPLLKRLKFDEKKLQEVIEGIDSLIALSDPVGKTLSALEMDKELELYKVSCPIGVIGVIFESRPDALVQISTLCLKSGNGVLLKGGSEAMNTNKILTKIISEASIEKSLPNGWVNMLETRSDVSEMLKLDEYIDLIIPRGSNEFVQYIMNNSNISVMGHADGICHTYIDQEADIEMAVKVAVDAKTQYVAVCNATETLLIHEKVAENILPKLKAELDKKNVEIFGCDRTQKIITVTPANNESWKTEYLDYQLSVKIVDNIDEAISHINQYGSGHTESILSANKETAQYFINNIDSGNLFWNCSTRFSDGFVYGLGAEVGISTNKIHARGPVGMEGLLIYKWILKGNGQIKEDYSNGSKTFLHNPISKELSF